MSTLLIRKMNDNNRKRTINL
jgi:hypothetical protein